MKLLHFFLLTILSIILCLPSKASNLLYGPWVHNVGEHGFTVLWVTEKPSLDYVELAEDDGSAFEASIRSRFYETSHGRRVTSRYHCVRIDGLQSGKVYRYRVTGKVLKDDTNPYKLIYGAEQQISPKKKVLSVKTLDSSADSCRFSVFNDIHANDILYSGLSEPVDPKETDFIVLNGDIVSESQNIDTLIKHTILPICEKAGQLPLFFVRGNHEGRGHDFDKVYSMFPTSTGEFWYSFRQGPAAFIVLDAGEDKHDGHCEYSGTADYDSYRQRETDWLEKAVLDTMFVSAPYKICLIHVPTIKFKRSWYVEKWITENWTPILEKAGIDLMLSGHVHNWICSESAQDGKNYPVLTNSKNERMDVTVTSHSLDVRTYGVDGTIIHHWKNEK